VALPGWSSSLLVIGLLMAFCGVGAGLLQSRSKVLLAYSSISQMGFILLTLGIGLGRPESWPLIAPVVLFYSLHHGLAKGTLFLGIGMAPARHHSALLRGLTAAGLLLPPSPWPVPREPAAPWPKDCSNPCPATPRASRRGCWWRH
jgi:formate hydrogenlyase subunit 3/multisubunit Na+/H+ antiporter MnhD subunit